MKKALFALSALALASTGAFAQSSVKLYGIMDVAVRFETNQGAGKTTLSTVAPGGMSQSRIGLDIVEDMGGGYRGVANLEHRLKSDDGNAAAADFWRQAWVGLVTPAGRVTLGRQYNVLFDLTTSTFASFKYSPYIEQFKPEIGVALSGRQSNMIKYALTQGGFTGEFQYSAGENTGDKTTGGMVRYATGGLALGAGLLNAKDPAGKQVKATVIGGAYTSGALYMNAAYAVNKFDAGFSPALTVGYSTALFSATTAANVLLVPVTLDVKDRRLTSFGMTYQITPQFNLGGQYYDLSQTHRSTAAKSSGKMFAIVGDYALSKRTDWYVEYDHVSISDSSPITFANGARSRSGYMTGVRHRF